MNHKPKYQVLADTIEQLLITINGCDTQPSVVSLAPHQESEDDFIPVTKPTVQLFGLLGQIDDPEVIRATWLVLLSTCHEGITFDQTKTLLAVCADGKAVDFAQANQLPIHIFPNREAWTVVAEYALRSVGGAWTLYLDQETIMAGSFREATEAATMLKIAAEKNQTKPTE